MESDETLEPPLCSCRMETPRNQDVVTLAEGKCMAVEGVDGKVLFTLSHTLDFLCAYYFLSMPLWLKLFLFVILVLFFFCFLSIMNFDTPFSHAFCTCS